MCVVMVVIVVIFDVNLLNRFVSGKLICFLNYCVVKWFVLLVSMISSIISYSVCGF